MNKEQTSLYNPNDYLFLDQIFYNPYALDDYIALDQVIGEWIDKSEINMDFFKILSKMYQEKKNQAELLLIQDPITKVARYFYFEYLNNKTTSFYITLSIGDLSTYLNISKNTLSECLQFLKSKQIIDKHNKLFNILNTHQLENYAYRLDW